MTFPRNIAFGFILHLAAAAISPAQEENFIKAEFITLSWKSNIKDLWFMSKEGARKLDVYERDFTMPEEYTGPPEIRFYESEAALRLPPEKKTAPRAVAKLPAKGGRLLLIFTPKEAADEGWDVRVLDNSPANFPPGAYRFMNLTPNAFQVALDGKVTSVGANSLAVVRPSRGEEIRDMPAQIGIGKKVVFSSVWGHREDRRTTVFVIPDPSGRNGIGVRRFYQAVIEPTGEE